ncbi:MAG: hypothetical protein ACREMY_05290 [bacterium]
MNTDATWLPIAVINPRLITFSHGGTTYVGTDDITRPVSVGNIVEAVDIDGGMWQFAVVTDVLKAAGLVWINLRHDRLRSAIRPALWLAQLRLWRDNATRREAA